MFSFISPSHKISFANQAVNPALVTPADPGVWSNHLLALVSASASVSVATDSATCSRPDQRGAAQPRRQTHRQTPRHFRHGTASALSSNQNPNSSHTHTHNHTTIYPVYYNADVADTPFIAIMAWELWPGFQRGL